MKVKDLIQELNKYNPEIDVLTKDYRGNEDYYVKNIEIIVLPSDNSLEFLNTERDCWNNLTENVLVIGEKRQW